MPRNLGIESFGSSDAIKRAQVKFSEVETSWQGPADGRSASEFAGFHESRGKIWLALTEKISLPGFLSGRPPCMIPRVKQLSEIRIFFTARIFSFGNLCLRH
jgi:hypothetical protein